MFSSLGPSLNILSSKTEILEGPMTAYDEAWLPMSIVAGVSVAVVVEHVRYVDVLCGRCVDDSVHIGIGCVKNARGSMAWTNAGPVLAM
jgi:hypothetical protein